MTNGLDGMIGCAERASERLSATHSNFEAKSWESSEYSPRAQLGPEKAAWLRLFADHAATAIANARAFEEIERLKGQLELENEYLREEVKIAHGFGEIVGQSEALRKVLDQVGLVGPADTSVLICGESGTGKELIARAIHECSRRPDRPMITVNCASVPHELFESEFFGHTKGAFTGAIRDRLGRFELADGGTLFLDEVGEIPLELQGKLLRVLQEGTFERIGDERTRTVDVRIVAASNRDLKQEVEAGRFRHDLYYRLSVFPIEVARSTGATRGPPRSGGSFSRADLRKIRRFPSPNSSAAISTPCNDMSGQATSENCRMSSRELSSGLNLETWNSISKKEGRDSKSLCLPERCLQQPAKRF